MKVIKFAPGLVPVLKHEEHDQSTHGSWSDGSQGSVSELADSEIQDILHNTKTIEQMYQKIADRLGKTLKPKVATIPEGEENLYRGLANVERDAQQLIDGKIPFTPFQTWGQGIYATPSRQDAEGYGQVVRMKLDSTAKIITGEPEPFAVDTSSTPFKSDFIDFPSLLPKITSGEIDNFSISDAYNIYYAAKGYDGYQPHGGEMVLFNGSHLSVNKSDIGTAVQKHQEHDQSTHGSWANGEPTSPLTGEEKSALTDYIKSGYLFVNGFLRKRDSMGAEDVKIQEEKQSEKIAMLDSLFEKAPALDTEKVLHRGLSGIIADKLRDAPVGSTFVDKGFVSTTEMIEIAQDFTSVGNSEKRAVLSITVSSGTKALKVSRFLSDEPRAALELEVILPRGLKFEITGRDANVIQVKVVPNE